MKGMKLPALLLALLMTVSVLAALPPAAASSSPTGGPAPMGDRPETNFTWLRADGVGSIGSTAMYIHDGDLDIFIEAFPATGTNWDPSTITECDLIFAEDHGHTTHYDADTVAMVQKNTGAIVVGNTAVANHMRSRLVPASKIVELSPTLSNTDSATNVAGCNITAIGMVHTLAPSIQVDTFYVEMPSGIKWFHGACASSSSYASYIENRALLDDLDMMALDFEHDFGTVWEDKSPNLLFKTHTFSPTGEGYYWDEDPGSTVHTPIYHNDTYVYTGPEPNVAPLLSLGQASPRDVTEDEQVTFRVFYADINDDAPTTNRVHIRDSLGGITQHDLSTVTSGNTWIDGKFLQYKTKLSPGTYTFRFEANDGEYNAFGDIDWHPETVNVSARNQVPELFSPSITPDEGDTTTTFRFDVMYRDGDNEEAATARIFIDGTGYDMVTDTVSGPWNSWVTFYYETTLDVSMNHRYYFQFSDGEDQVRHPLASSSPNWLPGPVVELPNYPPTLMSERFTPLTGTRDMEFTFYVIYTDDENDRPVTTYLFLDGTAYVLTADGYDYTNGVSHSFTTRMDVGPHEFHFVFSDGEHTVRLPVTGELEGPNVANRNPVAVISSPSDGVRFEPDEDIALRSSGTDDADGDPLDYTWTSDLDGQLGTVEFLDVRLSEGTHVITLLVEDPFSGSHGASVTIMVKPRLPVLGIEGVELNVANPIEGDNVRITASLGNSGEAKAEGVSVYIFVDGLELHIDTVSLDIDDTRTVTATWKAVAGTHEISVKIADVTSILAVQVNENDLPDVEITLVNPGEKFKPGEELRFQATVTDANDDPVAYEWDFGDGVTSTSEGPRNIYSDPGTYTVTLTVTDTRGGVTVETFTVEITKPKADDESPGPGAILALAAIATVVAAMVIRSKDE